MEEMRQSLRMVRQCLDQMPTDGPLKLVESNYVIPPHANVLRTAEDMQRHFVWVIKGFEAPKGEVYMAIEQSKGELGYYIYSDGSNTPYRLRLRTPDFVNLQVLPYMAQGAMLADMVALIGTIDIVLGSVDR
jgi:NADH:ubiquinone oxidoreductase subunit D